MPKSTRWYIASAVAAVAFLVVVAATAGHAVAFIPLLLAADFAWNGRKAANAT